MARRQFLRFLASSPLMAGSASLASVSALLATFPETSLAQSYDVLRAPVSSQGAFHPEAEVAVARAARARGHR
ncbi:MAG TPA: hypothetical protein VF928_11150 [Usitatibacteraceae bacterium]